MFLFAQTETASPGIVIGAVALFAVIFTLMVVALVALCSMRQCHRCNKVLHEVDLKAVPLNEDGTPAIPPGAKWYCSACQPTRYYGGTTEKPEDLIPNKIADEM